MKSTNPVRVEPKQSPMLPLALSWCLMFGPVLGCADTQTPSQTDASADANTGIQTPGASQESVEITPAVEPTLTESASATLEEAWHTITESTESGLTIVSEKCAVGSEMVVDSTKAAWIWSGDKTADGWDWIVKNAGDATEWAKDTATESWTITRNKSGEFSLWVQVEAKNGIAWARTSLPAAWKVTKDAAGKAVVWIDEHKVEVAVAAAVVAVIVAGLIVVPEGVAPAVLKGAVAGTMAETTKFLNAVWNGRQDTNYAKDLQTVTHDMFMSIGKSVVSQCGAQALGSLSGADAV